MISGDTAIHDATLLLRGILSSGVVDPISATRSSDSRFIITAYPEKTTEYPQVSVQAINYSTQRLGMASEMHWAKIPFEVRAWCRSVTEKDNITDQIVKTLRTYQYTGSATGTVDNGLYGFSIDSAINVDESGKNSVKSKVLEVTYYCILS